jgi:hypothetical protein
VRLEPKFPDDGIMVAVNVRVNTVHAFEDLADQSWERLGERDA